MKKVIKRSGQIVDFDRQKIYNAIHAAAQNEMTDRQVDDVTNFVVAQLTSTPNVEDIQNIVEIELMKCGFYEIARRYIRYRYLHEKRRNLMDSYKDIFFADSADVDSKRDNANINTDASMGIMLKLGAEGAKCFVDNYALQKRFSQADSENWIHIHDKDFSLITLNCCQIDLLKLFHGGFSTGHGYLREPNSIRSYASLACIAIQSNQNDMFGGQSINAFDYAMAEGVRKSFRKAVIDNICKAVVFWELEGISPQTIDLHSKLKETQFTVCYGDKSTISKIQFLLYEIAGIDATVEMSETIYNCACKDVEEETHQAMEALIHNFNTLHSRAGAQVPFSSINYGMDTSPEGQLVTDKLLDAIYAGLGNGETAIFPISVFQIKSGVNYNESDPNYFLFKKACKVSAKRLFPNFVNLDAPFNLQYYKPNDYNSYVASMGCRTRVMSNINGAEESGSRGNFAFVTINLPKLALESKGDMRKFYELYDKYIEISHDYLLERLGRVGKLRK